MTEKEKQEQTEEADQHTQIVKSGNGVAQFERFRLVGMIMTSCSISVVPAFGAWPDVEGLWVAAGHEGLGITTALGTGSMIADLIAGRPPGIDPAPFAPGRAATAVH